VLLSGLSYYCMAIKRNNADKSRWRFFQKIFAELSIIVVRNFYVRE
jgi:hypothetical protein